MQGRVCVFTRGTFALNTRYYSILPFLSSTQMTLVSGLDGPPSFLQSCSTADGCSSTPLPLCGGHVFFRLGCVSDDRHPCPGSHTPWSIAHPGPCSGTGNTETKEKTVYAPTRDTRKFRETGRLSHLSSKSRVVYTLMSWVEMRYPCTCSAELQEVQSPSLCFVVSGSGSRSEGEDRFGENLPPRGTITETGHLVRLGRRLEV